MVLSKRYCCGGLGNKIRTRPKTLTCSQRGRRLRGYPRAYLCSSLELPMIGQLGRSDARKCPPTSFIQSGTEARSIYALCSSAMSDQKRGYGNHLPCAAEESKDDEHGNIAGASKQCAREHCDNGSLRQSSEEHNDRRPGDLGPVGRLTTVIARFLPQVSAR